VIPVSRCDDRPQLFLARPGERVNSLFEQRGEPGSGAVECADFAEQNLHRPITGTAIQVLSDLVAQAPTAAPEHPLKGSGENKKALTISTVLLSLHERLEFVKDNFLLRLLFLLTLIPLARLSNHFRLVDLALGVRRTMTFGISVLTVVTSFPLLLTIG
jgi:hypothetical protein